MKDCKIRIHCLLYILSIGIHMKGLAQILPIVHNNTLACICNDLQILERHVATAKNSWVHRSTMPKNKIGQKFWKTAIHQFENIYQH